MTFEPHREFRVSVYFPSTRTFESVRVYISIVIFIYVDKLVRAKIEGVRKAGPRAVEIVRIKDLKRH